MHCVGVYHLVKCFCLSTVEALERHLNTIISLNVQVMTAGSVLLVLISINIGSCNTYGRIDLSVA